MLTPIDLLNDPRHDVLDPQFRALILRVLATGRVVWLHLGTPCSSFSQAVTPPYRTALYPEGLPGLNDTAAFKVTIGNRLLEASLEMHNVQFLADNGSGHENPRGSFQWRMAMMIQFCFHWGTIFYDSDYCQYGKEWLKPTRLMTRVRMFKSRCLTCVALI